MMVECWKCFHVVIVCLFFFCHRFESSHLFLELLLCKERKLASSLPLNQLWPSLIGAACQLTGEKRLKVVALLLQVLHLSSSSR